MTTERILKDQQFIAVLDFGAQYNQLIARRVRECNVYSEIYPHTITPEKLKALNPKGIILSGGPSSVYGKNAPTVDPGILKLGVPVLGICYGMQLMAHILGGDVSGGEHSEYGRTEMKVLEHGLLFADLNPQLIAWMSHGDLVRQPPEGFKILARTMNCPVAAMGDERRKMYGVQFHPEVTHTPWGKELIRNFALRVCKCKPTWTMGSYIDREAADRWTARGRLVPPAVAAWLLRALQLDPRRRGFGRGRGHCAPRRGQQTHLRVRGPRPHAPCRGHSDQRDLQRYI